MAKISSKSVPVIAAVVLLAGIFSVASAHAASKQCTKIGGPASAPSCTTSSMSFKKGTTVYFGAASMTNGGPGAGQAKVIRGNVSIAAKSYVSAANSSVKADMTTTYKVYARNTTTPPQGTTGQNGVLGEISTSPTTLIP